MPSKYEEEDLSKIDPISIHGRSSKVSIQQFVDPENMPPLDVPGAGGHIADRFPDVLAGASLKQLTGAIHRAKEKKKPILWLIGAHVIKCGLSLYVNSLFERGFITAMAATGSAAIHDLELAFFGETSEDVANELPAGRFGMSRETAELFKTACERADEEGLGLGEGIGHYIEAEDAPHKNFSLFATAYRKSFPATVHLALGTDIVHQHPGFPAATAGVLTMKDFRIITRTVGNLFDEGVVIIFGSAVILPEVFLKATAINYNLGRKPSGITAAGFDMIPQYRMLENVLRRPFQGCGESFLFLGHHEIMLPLLHMLLITSE